MRGSRMNIEHERPRAHLVVDDFFSASALETIFAEVASLEGKLEPGLVRELGHDGQSLFLASERRKNRAVWIHEGSKTLRLFRESLWAPPMVSAYEEAREPLFQIIPNCWAPHLQVSSYMTGDRYDFHEDEGAGVNLTAVVFLAANPKKVRGGDLVLAYGGDEKKIAFRHNRLVIFPSKTPHRVTPVKVASDDPRDARISLQCWLAYGQAPTKAKAGKAKGAVADVPTFLLAEEAIVARAQAFVSWTRAPSESADVLYWGVFYLTRILTANLRFLVSAQKHSPGELGPIRVRHNGGLEVYGTLRPSTERVRIGFRIDDNVHPAEALKLYVERGTLDRWSYEDRVLYTGTEAPEATALLEHLLAIEWPSRAKKSPRAES
jgi:hypothetical protein